jgi:Holliday junction resolvase RusA-like endonuclease
MSRAMIEITTPEKIPTINHLYYHRGNMKILKREARELRERIQIQVIQQTLGVDINSIKESKLRVRVEIFENWLTKKGKVKRKDIMNREKFLTDSVFKSLQLDDMYIYDYNIKKIQSETEKAIVRIDVIQDA